MQTSRTFLVTGSVLGFLGVVMGAFGAHALREVLSAEELGIVQTGIRYQMYHAFALLAAGWALGQYRRREFATSGWAFAAGVALFSGSLYLLTWTGIRSLGMITPLGGAAFLVGWFFLAKGFWNLR